MNISSICINLSDVYNRLSDEESAKKYINKADELAKHHNSKTIQSEIDIRIGASYLVKGDFTKAEEKFLAALMKLNQVENKFYLIDLLTNMADLEEVKGNNPMIYLNEAVDIANEYGLEVKVSKLYKKMADYYESNNEFKQAYNFFKAYHMKEKEVEALNLAKRLEVISIEFNYLKQKNEKEYFKGLNEKLKKEVREIK